MEGNKIPHFYILWKILKNHPVGGPIVAGYNWILTTASFFVGHFLKSFTANLISLLWIQQAQYEYWKNKIQ